MISEIYHETTSNLEDELTSKKKSYIDNDKYYM